MIMIFLALLFMKTPYKIFLLTFTMFKHVEVRKHIEYMCQILSKNMLIVEFYSGMKCQHVFFSFFHETCSSPKTCKQTFHRRQVWFHLWISSILGLNFTNKHLLKKNRMKFNPGMKKRHTKTSWSDGILQQACFCFYTDTCTQCAFHL